MYGKVHRTLYVITQGWKWSKCWAAVECVVVYLSVGILPGKKNEQATGASKTWMDIIKIMFIGRSQTRVVHSIYITGRKHVCGFWHVGNVLFFISIVLSRYGLFDILLSCVYSWFVSFYVYDCFNTKFN